MSRSDMDRLALQVDALRWLLRTSRTVRPVRFGPSMVGVTKP